MTSDTYSVLLVTKDTKISSLVNIMLIPPMFELSVCQDFNEARRKCDERSFNIVLVDFADGEGTDFAVDISDLSSTILLLTPQEHFDQISYKVEGYGVLTLTREFDQFYFYNMIKVAIAVQYKVQVLSSKAIQLKEKMEEIRIVNRAKMLLMQVKNMTEAEAHHYIEKEAMDTGAKKVKVSELIIKTLS